MQCYNLHFTNILGGKKDIPHFSGGTYLSGKAMSCSKNIMFTTAGGKENLIYSRIQSLGMGLSAYRNKASAECFSWHTLPAFNSHQFSDTVNQKIHLVGV